MLAWFKAGSVAAKAAMYGAMLLSLAGGVAVIKYKYDASIEAKIAAKAAAVHLETERADAARLVVSLTEQRDKAVAEATRLAQIKGNVSNAKQSFVCFSAPAIHAAVSGLRRNGGSH